MNFPPNTPAEPTVLWSGGYDSTALLIQYLADSRVRAVRTLYVALTDNDETTTRPERAAIAAIEPLLKAEFPNKFISHTEVTWPLAGHAFSTPQPLAWLTAAAWCAPTYDIATGWVRGDDVWHYRTEVHRLIYAMRPFQADEKPDLTLHTPFEWCTKDDLLKYCRDRLPIFYALSVTQDGLHWQVSTCAKAEVQKRLAKKLSQPVEGEAEEKVVVAREESFIRKTPDKHPLADILDP